MVKVNEDAFRYYFYFAHERMSVFWNKLHWKEVLSEDSIFQTYRFTNSYRVLDRVSQYLLKNIIYGPWDFSKEDIIFRILLFKIFNKIETWEYIESINPWVSVENFNRDAINKWLSDLIKKQSIFNAAYIITWRHGLYDHLKNKHTKRLSMLKNEIANKNLLSKIISASSLESIFSLLRNCSLIWDFLAYQYTIDINYSDFINFDENSFVKAWIWSIRWIKKCFILSDKEKDFEKYIKFTQTNFEKYNRRFWFKYVPELFWRKMTLIDIQNCFCETDKYLRVKMPKLNLWNKRIKQKYKKAKKSIELFFPPKRWLSFES